VRAAQNIVAAQLVAVSAGVHMVPPDPATTKRTIQGSIEKFLNQRRMNKASSTILHYAHALELFKRSARKSYLEEITRDDLMEFQAAMHKRGLSNTTRANKLVIVLIWLKSEGIRGLLNKDDKPVPDDPDREPYSSETLNAFFAECNEEEYDLFQFCMHTGMRDKEIRVAEWGDIKWADGVVVAFNKPEYDFHTKSRRRREIPIPDSLIELMRARKMRKPKSHLIFPSPPHPKCPDHRPGGGLNDKHLQMCKEVACRAGLNCGRCETSLGPCAEGPYCHDFNLHKFRHTFATYHSRSGVDIRTLADWMGHKNIATTQKYLQPARGPEIRKKVNAGVMAQQFRREAHSA